MKVNGNNKDNRKQDSSASSADQLSKNAAAVVEDIPVKNFDPVKTWQSIANKLGQVDKRFVTWGLAMAASVSMLVGARIDLLNGSFFEAKPVEKLEVSSIKVHKQKLLVNAAQPVIKPAKIEVQAIQPALTRPKVALDVHLAPALRPSSYPQKVNVEAAQISPFSNPFLFAFAKANFQSSGVAPEIGFDIKLAENYTAKRRDIYKIGLSSQLSFISNESGKKKIHPHTFVNVEFSSLSKKTNKGWTSRAGYLLNPDGQLYQDTTIKVSLFRNIGKNVKIGPEVIFTENLQKAYPSISLVLG